LLVVSEDADKKASKDEIFKNLGAQARQSSEARYLRFAEYVLRKISGQVLKSAKQGLWKTEIFLADSPWSRDPENQRRLVASLSKQEVSARAFPAHNKKVRILVWWSTEPPLLTLTPFVSRHPSNVVDSSSASSSSLAQPSSSSSSSSSSSAGALSSSAAAAGKKPCVIKKHDIALEEDSSSSSASVIETDFKHLGKLDKKIKKGEQKKEKKGEKARKKLEKARKRRDKAVQKLEKRLSKRGTGDQPSGTESSEEGPHGDDSSSLELTEPSDSSDTKKKKDKKARKAAKKEKKHEKKLLFGKHSDTDENEDLLALEQLRLDKSPSGLSKKKRERSDGLRAESGDSDDERHSHKKKTQSS